MRALLAEADGATRSLLHTALSQRGWHVSAVGSAAGALDAFRDHPYPLVLVGAALPDGRGADLCRAVRASTSGRAAYLLALLPDIAPQTLHPLVEAGVDDALCAPFDLQQLVARVALVEARMALLPGGAGDLAAHAYPERIARLEHALRVQQASLEELFRSAPEGIVVVDEHTRVVRVNGEFTRMFGYTPDEAMERPITELIVPAELREEGERIVRAAIRGERMRWETVHRNRDGSLLDVSLLATPIRVGNGSIGAYGIYRDITERKSRERALMESEARYRALFDQSPVGVFLCDAALRITHCNFQLTQITGAPASALLGAWLHEPRTGRVLPGLRAVEVDRAAHYEGPLSRGGEPRWVTIHYAPLHDSLGRVIGGIGVVEDTTERERAEQQMRAQAAELERVNAALRERTLELEAAMRSRSRLFSSMNHELRTPISSIMLYQELLLGGSLGTLTPEQTQALEHSHGAARHLLELVQDVLDLSKLDADKVVLHPSEVSLATLLRDLLPTVQPLAQHHGSRIELELSEDLPPVITDAQRVRQILLNLVSNAAKFGRARPIRVRCDARDGEVLVEVVDRGIGIDAADLPRIFEDFVQVGAAHEGGTGLGLAISRRLSQLLRGRLEVESRLGEGSTFRLVLPAVLLEASTPQQST